MGDELRERIKALEYAITGLLNVMNIQEHRSAGTFHLSADAFMPLWNDAKDTAQALVSVGTCESCGRHILDGEKYNVDADCIRWHAACPVDAPADTKDGR